MYVIDPQPAPAGESLERIKSRLILITMQRQANAGEPIKEINAVIDLRQASLDGHEPSASEWKSARADLADLADIAYLADIADLADLAYLADLADLADRAYLADLAYLADRAYLADLAYLADRGDLVNDLVILLGDRLPAIPALDRQILDAIEVEKSFSLEMSSWHNSCGTTHCRAGSAIILHPLGRELEAVFEPWLAGAVIYQKSTGRVPNFFASNDDAMEDIRACAAEQEKV